MESSSDFIRTILYKIHPEIQISESAVVYLQQLLAPYNDALESVPNVPVFIDWIPQVIPEVLAKYILSEVVKAIFKNNPEVEDFGGNKPEYIQLAIRSFFEYLITICLDYSSNLVIGSDKIITPWDLQNVIVHDEELSKVFGLSNSNTLPVNITIQNQIFTYDISLELLTGIYVFVLLQEQPWQFFVFGQPFTIDFTNPDEYILHATNTTHTQTDSALLYSIDIGDTKYTFDTPEFIQGILTASQWFNVDPHQYAKNLISLDGEDPPFTL